MRTVNLKMKLTAVIAVAAIAVVCSFIRVHAQDQFHPVPAIQFGILGITRGQTARLNVTNVASPDDPFYPPDPCRVTITFVDGDGNVLLNFAGQPVRREVLLQPGHSAFLQIDGDEFVPRGQARVNFRPVVRVLIPPPDPETAFPPDPCFPTLEVISNLTGHTALIYSGTPPFASPAITVN